MPFHTTGACSLVDARATLASVQHLIRAGVLALLVSVPTFAADVRVLTPSGVSIDGVGIAGIDGPTGGPDGSTVFRATTTSLAAGAVPLASGDPLPAPLRGTIDTISYGIAAGDRVAVVATTTGPDAASAVLVVQGRRSRCWPRPRRPSVAGSFASR